MFLYANEPRVFNLTSKWSCVSLSRVSMVSLISLWYCFQSEYGFFNVTKKWCFFQSEYGFLDYEAEPGRKLFFHMSELEDGINISVGDDVEFVLIQNQRNGKYSAVSLRKLTDSKRPDRLLSRLKSTSDDVKVMLVRKPRGPDGTKGFALVRKK